MSKTLKTAWFVLCMTALIGTGCTNEQDQQREDAAAILTEAQGLVTQAAIVVELPVDPDVMNQAIDTATSQQERSALSAYASLQSQAKAQLSEAITKLDGLASGQTGEDGQRAAAAMLAASAHQLLAELTIGKADVLQAANAMDLETARGLVELAAQARALANTIQRLPQGDALTKRTESLARDRKNTEQVQDTKAAEVKDLQAQVSTLEADNSVHQAQWDESNTEAEAAESTYRELGPNDGFTHFQTAVQARIGADAEEFGIEENNMRLKQLRGSRAGGPLIGDLNITQSYHDGLASELLEIQAIKEDLETLKGDLGTQAGKLNAAANRLEDEARALLTGVDNRSSQSLAPIYDQAKASLSRCIASAAKARTGLAGSDRSLPRLQEAQAHSTQGRVASLVAQTESTRLVALVELAGLSLPANAEGELLEYDGTIASFITGAAQQAATLAGAHDMIEALPSGYDTNYAQWRADLGRELLAAIDSAMQNAGVNRDVTTAVRAYLTDEGATINSLHLLLDASRVLIPADMREAFLDAADTEISGDLIAGYTTALVLPRRIAMARALASGNEQAVNQCSAAVNNANQEARTALENARQALDTTGSDPRVLDAITALNNRVAALSGQTVDWEDAIARAAARPIVSTGSGSPDLAAAPGGSGYDTVEALVAALNSGTGETSMFYASSPTGTRVLSMFQSMESASLGMISALKETFGPGAAAEFTNSSAAMFGGTGYTIVSRSDTRAELQASSVMGSTSGVAVKVNGRWYFSLDDIPPEMVQMMGMLEAFAPQLQTAMADIERQIRNGSISSAQEAMTKLGQAVMEAMGMGDMGEVDLSELFGGGMNR